MKTRRFALLPAFLAIAALAACTSPEAVRTRGGGPGADIGNHAPPVEMHAGAEPYYGTPCAVARLECTGPPAIFQKPTKSE